jgi:oligopeptide transport system permease protein
MTSLSPKNLPSADLAPAQLERGVSPWLDAWRRLRRNHLAVFGGVTLIVLSLLCVIGPLFSPYGYEETNLDNTFSPPSAAHWLGTDQLGRDLFTRLMFGVSSQPSSPSPSAWFTARFPATSAAKSTAF